MCAHIINANLLYDIIIFDLLPHSTILIDKSLLRNSALSIDLYDQFKAKIDVYVA